MRVPIYPADNRLLYFGRSIPLTGTGIDSDGWHYHCETATGGRGNPGGTTDFAISRELCNSLLFAMNPNHFYPYEISAPLHSSRWVTIFFAYYFLFPLAPTASYSITRSPKINSERQSTIGFWYISCAKYFVHFTLLLKVFRCASSMRPQPSARMGKEFLCLLATRKDSPP